LTGKVQSGGRLNLAQALSSTDNRPMNDDFATRAQLSGPNVRVRASNAGATREAGEPVHASVTGGASLWWTWTAPSSSLVAFDTAGSSFDTVLAVYTGTSLSTLQSVASNDDASASVTTSRVLINATAGTTYQIAVDGKNGATGTVALQIGTVPANDNFANAQVVSGVSFVTSGFTSNATAETGEPNPTGASNGLTVWYQWTAPATGHYVLAAFATQIDAVAAVYTGTALGNLTTVASNDNSASYNSDSLVPFNATAGTTYYFQISNTDTTGGDFTLSLTDALWEFPAGMFNSSLSTLPSPDITSSPAVAANGTVYFGSMDSFVYALNADGSQKWDRATGDSIDMASPALGADGTVYIGSNDGYLYALNGSTGARKWQFSATTAISSAPAIGSDGTIYFRDDDNLYALTDNGTTVTKKWSVALSGPTYCSPTIGTAGTIYVGATGGTFYAVNPDGTTKWTYTANGDIYTSPAIAADGTIYFATLSGSFYALTDNGTSASRKWIWNNADGSSITSSPAIGTDGTIYFAGYDHKLHALRPDGTERWSYTAADEVRASTPAIAADGTIYFGDYDSQLYAVNPNGTLQRVYSTALHIRSSPVIANNRLYFGSSDAKLYAFNLGQNAAASVWPMFQQNATHTARAVSGTPVITTQPQSQIAPLGGTLTLSVAASGTVTGYQWSQNGVAISGATGPHPDDHQCHCRRRRYLHRRGYRVDQHGHKHPCHDHGATAALRSPHRSLRAGRGRQRRADPHRRFLGDGWHQAHPIARHRTRARRLWRHRHAARSVSNALQRQLRPPNQRQLGRRSGSRRRYHRLHRLPPPGGRQGRRAFAHACERPLHRVDLRCDRRLRRRARRSLRRRFHPGQLAIGRGREPADQHFRPGAGRHRRQYHHRRIRVQRQRAENIAHSRRRSVALAILRSHRRTRQPTSRPLPGLHGHL
jgi:outer membrane protein assembly factor BamB